MTPTSKPGHRFTEEKPQDSNRLSALSSGVQLLDYASLNHLAKWLAGVSVAGFCVATVFLPAPARAQQSPAVWQSQSIYQIITDRFYDGDSSNNNAEGNYSPANNRSVHGGDFRGIEQKLDYIKALGATAIWISPAVLNGHGQFHGYAGRDFYQVAPHWGSLADLQHMIQAAHARGMLVIDDIIVNHGDDLIYSTDPGYASFLAPPAGYTLKYRSSSLTYAPPFGIYNSIYTAANNALTDLFHNYGAIPDYNSAEHVELGELSGLDDFRTESAYVRSNMVEIYKYWIGQAGFYGFRIDTVKHVEMGFWQNWSPLVHTYAAGIGKPNFFMFGEVYDGSDAKCGSYTGTQGGGLFKLDSVLDYPLYFLVNSVFATASGNTAQIENRYAALAANYDPAAQDRLVTFLDNHDQARFLSAGNANGNTDRLKVALVFLYTARGIPCLYYGSEQAFNGGNDPYDREDMFAGQFKDGPAGVDSFNMTHPLFQWVARLNNFRRLYPALLTGSHANLWNNPDGPGLFSYARRLNTQEVFVVFNTAGSAQTLPARPTTYPAGTTLVNLLDTNETLTVTAGPQTPSITVPGTSSKMFIARSQWLPLDPVVTGITPAHDTAGFSATAPVVIQFSQPMDTGSVVSAFSTLPAASGRFSWSPARDTLTFIPTAGFPTQTLVTVQIAATAQAAASSNAFHAAFTSRFKTGDLYSSNDGIPDWWRLQYFGHAAGLAADLSRADDDADGDGMSNLAEFLAGTNPLDGTSVFKITGTVKAGDEVQLEWTTRSNKTYQLQQSDGLEDGAPWTNLGSAVEGTDGVVTQSFGAPAGDSRFFRVQAH